MAAPTHDDDGARGVSQGLRMRLRQSKLLILFELAVLAAIFFADERQLIFFSKTLYLLAFAWLSLFVRGVRWRDLGLRLPPNWRVLVFGGVAAGIAMSGLELFVTQPVLVRLTGEWPDLSDFRPLIGNVQLLVLALILSWTLAAIGEELVYRGWLLNRLEDLFGQSRIGIIAAVAAMTVIFAFAHGYQGFTGVAENAVAAVLLALLYLKSGRNLIVPMVAHGVVDSIDVILIFMNRYPGM